MENLVCDLQSALDLNIRLKNSNQQHNVILSKCNFSRVAKHKYESNTKLPRQSSNKQQKNQIDCCKLTKSIVSQAVLSATSLNNLVRLKTNTSNSPNRSKLYVKTKTRRKIFKIQKTFRFRNYRLRCIRLRRESRLQHRHRSKQINYNLPFNIHNQSVEPLKAFSLHKSSNTSNDASLTVEEEDVSSSSVESNSDSSVTSNSFETTSVSSASDNDLSLTECFKSTKFMNSSDPSKEDEEEDEAKDKNNNTLKRKSQISLLQSSKSSRSKQPGHWKHNSTTSSGKHSSKYFNGMLNSDKHCGSEVLKRKRFNDEDEEQLLESGTRRTTGQKTRSRTEVVKKLRTKANSFDKLESDKQQILLRCVKKNDKNGRVRNEDTSGKETDEDIKMSNNLKKNCKKLSTRHKHQAEKNRHSYNRAIKHQADNEADDEQSDWPVNENTSTAQIKNMDTEFVEAEEEEDSSIQNVVPWWEQDTADLTTKNTYFEACLQNSNYQILNRNENEDKAKEFDEILNGALDLMSSTSKCAYQAKIDSMSNQRHRSNSLATGSMRLATKSVTNLGSYLNNHIPVDLEKAPAISENNIGYKMLQKMGWRPGFGSQPIIALMRVKKEGFGYSSKRPKEDEDK